MYRLGIFTTHPIQYYTPWFRRIAELYDLEVFYAHRQDARGQGSAGFKVAFEWDIPLLEGYKHRWLRNIAREPGVDRFDSCDTPEIFEIVRTERFDAFLVFGWGFKSAIQTVAACWRTGTPVLMRGDSQLTTRRSTLKVLAKYLPYRALLPRLDAHLYVGQRNRAYLSHYGVPESRLFFAPHFVDNTFFAERSAAFIAEGRDRTLRDKLGIPRGAFVALFAGKFTPIKRPQDVIGGFIAACRQADSADMHLIMVGDGPMHDELVRLAQPFERNIHFVGFRNQSELPLWYAAASALVLPGDETWGLVVNEAMACGRPAVVSDGAGCSADLIVEGRTGFTYPMGDTAALGHQLNTLRAILRDRPGDIVHALEGRIANYSIDGATEGLRKALDRIVRPARRALPWHTS